MRPRGLDATGRRTGVSEMHPGPGFLGVAVSARGRGTAGQTGLALQFNPSPGCRPVLPPSFQRGQGGTGLIASVTGSHSRELGWPGRGLGTHLLPQHSLPQFPCL